MRYPQRIPRLRSCGACQELTNLAVDMAKKHDCGVIAFENLSSFKGMIRGLKKKSKALGQRYNKLMKRGEDEEKAKVLREKHSAEKMIELLKILPWGRFAKDMESEAKWNDIIPYSVYAPATSTTCPKCGHQSKENRMTRGQFRCVECSFTMQAELVAALNIAIRAHNELRNRLKRGDKKELSDEKEV